MVRAEQTLLDRYARAYLNVFEHELASSDITVLQQAEKFFITHKHAFYFLSLSTITLEQKLKVMSTIFAKLNLPASLNNILSLLIAHKRGALWGKLFARIISLYLQRLNIVRFTIETATTIDTQAQETVRQFLACNINSDIIYNYKVNADLIAGIKAVSDTVMWEHSIAKNIKTVRLLLQEGKKIL